MAHPPRIAKPRSKAQPNAKKPKPPTTPLAWPRFHAHADGPETAVQIDQPPIKRVDTRQRSDRNAEPSCRKRPKTKNAAQSTRSGPKGEPPSGMKQEGQSLPRKRSEPDAERPESRWQKSLGLLA